MRQQLRPNKAQLCKLQLFKAPEEQLPTQNYPQPPSDLAQAQQKQGKSALKGPAGARLKAGLTKNSTTKPFKAQIGQNYCKSGLFSQKRFPSRFRNAKGKRSRLCSL